METSDVISIVAIIISIGGIIINYWYVKKEFKIRDIEFKRKRNFESIIYTINDVVKQIREEIREFPYFLSPLDISGNDILSYIHDNKLESLKLDIKINRFEMFINSIKEIKKLEEAKSEMFKNRSKKPRVYGFNSIYFSCEPDIFQNDSFQIDFLDYLSNMYGINDTLNKYKNMIDIYDNSVLYNYEKTLDDLIEMVINLKDKKIEVKFSKDDTSDEIYDKLTNSFIDMGKVKGKITYIENEIIPKLNAIQKEMINKI